MPINNFEYTHPDGWEDEANFPETPAKEQVRSLFQEQHKEVRDYIKNTLVPGVNAIETTANSAKSGVDTLTDPNIKFLQVRGVRNNG